LDFFRPYRCSPYRCTHWLHVYFSKGAQYWKYDLAAAKVLPGYPMPFPSPGHFMGAPTSPDAALSHPFDGKSIYFFKNSSYWKYDFSTGAMVAGYPRTYGTGTGRWEGESGLLGVMRIDVMRI
jgi:hypothetical protein